MRERPALFATAFAVVLLCLVPILSLLWTTLHSDAATWQAVLTSLLPGYGLTTVILVLCVGTLALCLGVASAFLVVFFAFPGARAFSLLLAFPLAFPAYVMAFAYTDLLDYSGLIARFARSVLGIPASAFPEVRSIGGAILILSLAFYPYVFFLARASFSRLDAGPIEAATCLGCSLWKRAFLVTFPMARSGIVAGLLIVVMETLADYGAVAHLGVQTLSTGLFDAWIAQGNLRAASGLALFLFFVAFALFVLERLHRKGTQTDRARHRPPPRRLPLGGARGALASAFCASLVGLGFVVPALNLLRMAAREDGSLRGLVDWDAVNNSLTLAFAGSALVLAGALIVGLAERERRSVLVPHYFAHTARVGYAVPGAVIAIGLLLPASQLDRVIATNFGALGDLRLTLSGSLLLLLLAYASRFMGAGLGAIESGFASIHPLFSQAARCMGSSYWRTVLRIDLPLLWPALASGFLIVFVEIIKELPATLILRPLDFDTLAVRAFIYASDERLESSAALSLIILAFGLLPVFILTHRLDVWSKRP